jgi:hypothetical protein
MYIEGNTYYYGEVVPGLKAKSVNSPFEGDRIQVFKLGVG